tara:strand:+ start:91 stop:582 length:492 start_codon:yes stop_codon:yes gene_type:complete
MSTIPSNFADGVWTITDDAGHSATLALSAGDFTIGGLAPAGRTLTVTESRGAVVGARLAARAIPTFSGSATLSSPAAAFQMLALGETAGFTSVLATIGDGIGVNMAFSTNYGAESRSWAAEDAVFDTLEVKEGDPSTITYSGRILGPLSVTGPEGTFVLIAAR